MADSSLCHHLSEQGLATLGIFWKVGKKKGKAGRKKVGGREERKGDVNGKKGKGELPPMPERSSKLSVFSDPFPKTSGIR